MTDDLTTTLIREFRDMHAELLRAIPVAIAAALDAGKQSAALTRADRAALAALLPTLAAARRRSEIAFTATEALAHAQKTPGVVGAIQPAIGPNNSGAARRLGKLLARTEGIVVDGLVVSRAGEVREGALWSVMRV